MFYVCLTLSWVGFALVHSLTASLWFKQKISNLTGTLNRYYRLLYNAVALLTFLPLLLLHRMAPTEYVGDWHGSASSGKLIIGIGVAVGLIALAGYDLAEFIGWPVATQSSDSQQLRQNGLLRYVRHPLYTGIMLSLAGVWINSPTWSHLILFLAATLYIRIGIYFEERNLLATFGNSYLNYRKRVPMLFPRLSARRRHERAN